MLGFPRNLNSEDTLKLWTHFTSFRGFLLVGWFIAFLQIPITTAVIRRKNTQHRQETEHLRKSLAKAEKLLQDSALAEPNLPFNKKGI